MESPTVPPGKDLPVRKGVCLLQLHRVGLQHRDGLHVPGAPHLRHVRLKVEREPDKN